MQEAGGVNGQVDFPGMALEETGKAVDTLAVGNIQRVQHEAVAVAFP